MFWQKPQISPVQRVRTLIEMLNDAIDALGERYYLKTLHGSMAPRSIDLIDSFYVPASRSAPEKTPTEKIADGLRAREEKEIAFTSTDVEEGMITLKNDDGNYTVLTVHQIEDIMKFGRLDMFKQALLWRSDELYPPNATSMDLKDPRHPITMMRCGYSLEEATRQAKALGFPDLREKPATPPAPPPARRKRPFSKAILSAK